MIHAQARSHRRPSASVRAAARGSGRLLLAPDQHGHHLRNSGREPEFRPGLRRPDFSGSCWLLRDRCLHRSDHDPWLVGGDVLASIHCFGHHGRDCGRDHRYSGIAAEGPLSGLWNARLRRDRSYRVVQLARSNPRNRWYFRDSVAQAIRIRVRYRPEVLFSRACCVGLGPGRLIPDAALQIRTRVCCNP